MPPPSTPLAPKTTSRTRRRLLWFFSILAILLILALTPPLLNVNRLSRRIAASMSASLGRPVHLDRVSVHLLPVPGFTLENLVVSEDPAFGFEPTIRANTVEATIRTSSLWRRQVEFSSIRFIEPSLNLVRNAQGKWNLQSLLVHAASVDTAPTAQRKAGLEPRFPYIEATGARVNLKLGDEKKPFSLTEADFALWLPTPAQWRIRLEGKPARTDTNINDPGTIRLEGSLQRASGMANVPVDLHASWDGAPLGEASKLLTGHDADWRGNLTVEATLAGPLGAAKLATKVHLEDLRRADFVPAKSLDIAVECTGTLELMTAVVHTPACTLPAQQLTAVADSLDLTGLALTGLAADLDHQSGTLSSPALQNAPGLRVGSPGISEAWLLDWARLFSERIPAQEGITGKVAGSLAYIPSATPGTGSSWQGDLHGNVRGVKNEFTLTAVNGGTVLAPVNLAPEDLPPLLLSGTSDHDGYTLYLDGLATAQQLATLRSEAPQLTDGLAEAAPEAFASQSAKPLTVAATCTRPWKGPQTCTAASPEPPNKPSHHTARKHRQAPAARPLPSSGEARR